MLNLPLSNFNKDEIYTFIVGLVVGAAWFLYLQKFSWISDSSALTGPSFLLTWLSSTGTMYVIYLALCWIVTKITDWFIAHQNEEAVLRKLNIQKGNTFFWTGPLEEEKIKSHILGLMTVAIGLIYWPLLVFVSPKTFASCATFHVTFLLFMAVLVAEFFIVWLYLQRVNKFLDKNYCDIIDQKPYTQERARLYAQIKHAIWVASQHTDNPRQP